MGWVGTKIAVILLLLLFASCRGDENFRKKIKPIKEGMHLNEVESILGKPFKFYETNRIKSENLIFYQYKSDCWYDSKFEIIFNKKDSLVISYGFEDPLLF
ncbi:hypothetical protein GO491_01210 [Flavobacteriaceae bacterium Ap0902]|nr:hypothetical protein [Flavobacteriaceae bacterium Ap0902]